VLEDREVTSSGGEHVPKKLHYDQRDEENRLATVVGVRLFLQSQAGVLWRKKKVWGSTTTKKKKRLEIWGKWQRKTYAIDSPFVKSKEELAWRDTPSLLHVNEEHQVREYRFHESNEATGMRNRR